MRRLPEILAERRSSQGVELDLRVPSDLEYFAGHFPGAPVLPGVVLLDWCMRLAEGRLALPGSFRGLEQVKFLSPVGPEARVTLTLHLKGERLGFTYAENQKKLSSGSFVLGA